MSIDLFVMPLWRFKLGAVAPASQRALGGGVTLITPQGIVECDDQPEPTEVELRLARRRAERVVRTIVKEISVSAGTCVTWNDDGEVVYESQAQGCFVGLRGVRQVD
jgi:hypothetical protein